MNRFDTSVPTPWAEAVQALGADPQARFIAAAPT